MITQCTQYRLCCFRRPINQFKWTEHTSITGVATTGFDTPSASPRHAPYQTAYRDLVDAVPLPLRAAVRACTVAKGCHDVSLGGTIFQHLDQSRHLMLLQVSHTKQKTCTCHMNENKVSGVESFRVVLLLMAPDCCMVEKGNISNQSQG